MSLKVLSSQWKKSKTLLLAEKNANPAFYSGIPTSRYAILRTSHWSLITPFLLLHFFLPFLIAGSHGWHEILFQESLASCARKLI